MSLQNSYIKLLTLGFLFTLLQSTLEAKIYSTCPYPQHEITIQYGYLSNEQAALKHIDELRNVGDLKSFIPSDASNPKFSFIGPVHFNYKFFVKEKLAVGASAIYGFTKMSYTSLANNRKLSKNLHAVSVMPRLDFYYLRNPKFAIYGNLGAGVMILRSSSESVNNTGVSAAYQVTPFALRIGRDFAFNIEFGFGTQGVVSGGFSYRHYDRPWTGL